MACLHPEMPIPCCITDLPGDCQSHVCSHGPTWWPPIAIFAQSTALLGDCQSYVCTHGLTDSNIPTIIHYHYYISFLSLIRGLFSGTFNKDGFLYSVQRILLFYFKYWSSIKIEHTVTTTVYRRLNRSRSSILFLKYRPAMVIRKVLLSHLATSLISRLSVNYNAIIKYSEWFNNIGQTLQNETKRLYQNI